MKGDVCPGGCMAVDWFRLQFQQRMADYLLGRGSTAEGFGVVWERTLAEIPLEGEAQGALYRELINWAKSNRLLDGLNGARSAAQGQVFSAMRRSRLVEIVLARAERSVLETRHGQVWDTRELAQDFELLSLAVPRVKVRRRRDGVLGSLEFQADPRFYFNFTPESQIPMNGAAGQPLEPVLSCFNGPRSREQRRRARP